MRNVKNTTHGVDPYFLLLRSGGGRFARVSFEIAIRLSIILFNRQHYNITTW